MAYYILIGIGVVIIFGIIGLIGTAVFGYDELAEIFFVVGLIVAFLIILDGALTCGEVNNYTLTQQKLNDYIILAEHFNELDIEDKTKEEVEHIIEVVNQYNKKLQTAVSNTQTLNPDLLKYYVNYYYMEYEYKTNTVIKTQVSTSVSEGES